MGRGRSGAKQTRQAAQEEAEERRNQEATRTAASTGKRVNNDILKAAIQKLPASDFAQYNQPEQITVGNVVFNRITGGQEIQDAKGIKYVTSYQSSEQASNGEWPVFEVAVYKRFGRAGAKYVFGPTGTRLT